MLLRFYACSSRQRRENFEKQKYIHLHSIHMFFIRNILFLFIFGVNKFCKKSLFFVTVYSEYLNFCKWLIIVNEVLYF